MPHRLPVRVPASTSNLGPGFDLGQVDGPPLGLRDDLLADHQDAVAQGEIGLARRAVNQLGQVVASGRPGELMEEVGGQVLEIETVEAAALVAELRDITQLENGFYFQSYRHTDLFGG